MKKVKKGEMPQVDENLMETVSFGSLCQKPGNRETNITKNLLEGSAAFPVLSDKEMNVGVLRYDTPHLKKHKASTFIVAILPLELQAAFRTLFAGKFPQYADEGHGSVVFSGSTHQENIFYNKMETLASASQFPDILITTDLNSLYHRSSRLLNDRNFETFNYALNSMYADTKISHPARVFGYLGAEALVLVAHKAKYETTQPPREWYELLNPALRSSIVFSGDRDFHCNTVFAHFVKEYGYEALKQLGKNTLTRIHPEEMLLTINAGNKIDASIYVMPYSYAKKIENNLDYEIIWPNDGAILLPVQMLVKRGAFDKYKDVIRFLIGREVGELLEQHGLVAANAKVNNALPGTKLNWIGWNFIRNCDMHALKEDIRRHL